MFLPRSNSDRPRPARLFIFGLNVSSRENQVAAQPRPLLAFPSIASPPKGFHIFASYLAPFGQAWMLRRPCKIGDSPAFGGLLPGQMFAVTRAGDGTAPSQGRAPDVKYSQKSVETKCHALSEIGVRCKTSSRARLRMGGSTIAVTFTNDPYDQSAVTFAFNRIV